MAASQKVTLGGEAQDAEDVVDEADVVVVTVVNVVGVEVILVLDDPAVDEEVLVGALTEVDDDDPEHPTSLR